VTIVVFVAVQDVTTSYTYTQFKHGSFKLQNSAYLIRILQHFRLFLCPALASELNTEDVNRAVGNLKNNKATGTGGIHPGLIKYGGNKLLNGIYEMN
jgi:hypothetical protein